MNWETCEIIYVIVEEKWGIFPKETAQFQTLIQGENQGLAVMKSVKFDLEKLNTAGPNKKNKKHKAAFDAFTAKLAEQGWQQCGQGDLWFNWKLQRPIS